METPAREHPAARRATASDPSASIPTPTPGPETRRATAASERLWGLAAVSAAAALWALGGVLSGSLLAHGVQPLDLVATRTDVTAIALALVVALRHRGRLRAVRPVGSAAVLVAYGITVAIANAALVIAIQRLPVAVAMVLQSLAPALVLLWISIRTHTRPRRAVALGLLLALPGAALVVHPAGSAASARIQPAGIIAGLVTAVAVAAFTLLGTEATRARGTVEANAIAFAVAGIGWFVLQLAHVVPAGTWHAAAAPEVLAVAVLGTLVPFVLFAWGARRIGPAAGAVGICLEPAFSAVLAWPWLHQRLSAAQLAGAVVVVAAVALTQSSDSRGGRAPHSRKAGR